MGVNRKLKRAWEISIDKKYNKLMSQDEKPKEQKPAKDQSSSLPVKISKEDVDALKAEKEKTIKENQTVQK